MIVRITTRNTGENASKEEIAETLHSMKGVVEVVAMQDLDFEVTLDPSQIDLQTFTKAVIADELVAARRVDVVLQDADL